MKSINWEKLSLFLLKIKLKKILGLLYDCHFLSYRSWWRYSPIGANEWANPRSTYLTGDRCWTRVNSASTGDVAATGGHVGIVTGYRTTTSAAKDAVVKNDWGFRRGQSPVFWRYTC